MTKADLISAVADKLKLPAGRAELIVDRVFNSMVEALQKGDGIEIRGFGSFSIREYKAYEGRNPRTGQTVNVDPKRLAFFRVGKELRERVNDGRERFPLRNDEPSGPVVTQPVRSPGGSSR